LLGALHAPQTTTRLNTKVTAILCGYDAYQVRIGFAPPKTRSSVCVSAGFNQLGSGSRPDLSVDATELELVAALSPRMSATGSVSESRFIFRFLYLYTSRTPMFVTEGTPRDVRIGSGSVEVSRGKTTVPPMRERPSCPSPKAVGNGSVKAKDGVRLILSMCARLAVRTGGECTHAGARRCR
jgi:hypothetical protein